MDRLLISAKEAAKMLSISLAFFYSQHNSGKIPAPRKLGRRSLWSVQELKDWDKAGCPERIKWQSQTKRKTEL